MSINATLIGQMITFTLLVWFTMKYVWPPLIEALEERKQKISEGLAAAEKGQEDVKLAEKRAIKYLKEAKAESANIIALAQKRANDVVAESKQTAKVEGEKLIEAAKAQISQEIQQAKESLRKEVSSLALKAAEQILQEEVDKAKHKELINKVSEQL
ncbi:MAG: F0F1 ATP synthase subunit B [Methylococcales symbiont of Hymedesmia sp. n. MRB-2018]|nr:MAG: F0F1 ATP synthase subunit B [Methylococcales symbiont of Hymedesmia sp. n. MRB-2018]KAF3984036.1 MAG: F0F1 ATP synthase subunit B [Methylococcales symbiont of Hymedesmia sp. n. MRB-2018]